jgi:hypothetical protein
LAVHLGKDDFHPGKQFSIDPNAGRPSIVIRDGIFHAAATTEAGLELTLKRGEGSQNKPSTEEGMTDRDRRKPEGAAERKIRPFARIIGANIYLKDENDILMLEWLEMGLPRALTLKKPPAGMSYEIYIINDPLYDDPEEAKGHDELAEYYKVLKPSMSDSERLKLEVKYEDPARGSAKAPCMPVLLGGD